MRGEFGEAEMELGLGEVVGGAMVGEVEEVSLDEVSAAILFYVAAVSSFSAAISRPPLTFHHQRHTSSHIQPPSLHIRIFLIHEIK
ncbi:hypothetical protein IMZ48_32300 [Candidatus Bathyarchaeota archaeon]|nr:hypothetical protein [Candidatus Bathyarchaeota archaeon]